MSETVRFLGSMLKDEALAAEVKQARANAGNREAEIQAVLAVAKEKGFEVDGKELEAAVSEVIKFSQSDELSDEDLEKAAGGWTSLITPFLYKGFDAAMDAANMAEANRQVLNGIDPQVGKSYDQNVKMGEIMIDAGSAAGNAIASFFSSW